MGASCMYVHPRVLFFWTLSRCPQVAPAMAGAFANFVPGSICHFETSGPRANRAQGIFVCEDRDSADYGGCFAPRSLLEPMRAADTPVQEATANTPDGENAIGVCIKLRLDCLRTTPEPPSSWGDDFMGLIRPGARIPALRLLMASLRLEDVVPLEGVRVKATRRGRRTIQAGLEAPVPADAVLRAGIHLGAVQSRRGLYEAPAAAAAASRPRREFDDASDDDEEVYVETYRRGVQRPLRAPAHLANPVLSPPLIACPEQAYFGTPPVPMHPAYPDPRVTTYGYSGLALGRGGGPGGRMPGHRMGMAPPDDFMFNPCSPHEPLRPESSLESLVAASADINQAVRLKIVRLLRGMQEPRRRRPFDDVHWDKDLERARISLEVSADWLKVCD